MLTDTPNGRLTIRSGFSENIPNHIIVLPFVYEEQVIGVIEMGALSQFNQSKLDFMQNALVNIAIAFNTAKARARIDELLLRTQDQAEELQAQGEELRVANEELESQTHSLRTSEGAPERENSLNLNRQMFNWKKKLLRLKKVVRIYLRSKRR